MTTPQKKPYKPVNVDDVANDEIEQEDKDAQNEEDLLSSMDIQQQLYYYCRRGKIDDIKRVSKSCDINKRDEEGTSANPYITRNTALHYAVQSGKLETVQVIYNLGAKLDVLNKLRATPLHLAAALGYTQIVQELVNLKAAIDAPNLIGNTPLHTAIYAGHVDTVKVLLNYYKDDINDQRQALMTPKNAAQMSPVRYTAHDDMKKFLRSFFPSKDKSIPVNDNDIEEDDDDNDNNIVPAGSNASPNKNNNNNNIIEQDDDNDDDYDETAKLNVTASNQ